MKQYDFIIVGGGAAGLSLAYNLACSPLRNCSILIVDKSRREGNERGAGVTWAFWSRQATPFDAIVSRSWNQFLVATNSWKQTLPLGPYRYKVIHGADFFRFAHEKLSYVPNIEFMQARVDRVEDGDHGASIYIMGRKYSARYIFDSRFDLARFNPDALNGYAHCRYMKMQFRAWEIETQADSPAFDGQAPTFLDFRTPERGGAHSGGNAKGLRFFYVLPYSGRRALVEHVLCTNGDDELLHCAEHEQALDAYIKNILGIEQYSIVAEEHGISPMTDYKFPRREGRHVMSIGVAGGMLKPTTGFAFMRIQRDSAAIVRSLVKHGQPFEVPAAGWGYQLYDSLMLRTMSNHGPQISRLLGVFFRYGSTKRILRFLDERGTPF